MGRRPKPTSDGQWTGKERLELVSFLQLYQERALAAHRRQRFRTQKRSTTIGDVEFPTLTFEAVSKAHLALPAALTSKQRKLVHECCVELFLYHGTVDDKKSGDRTILVSIYADGIPKDCHRHGPKVALYMYQPFCCRIRKDTELFENGLEQIDALIDQPSECLRDDDDVLDLVQLETLTVTPPQENNLLLVDTLEAMRKMQDNLERHPPSLIAFDLEAYNESKVSQLTCLLQLSVLPRGAAIKQQQHYVIDPLAPGIWDEIHVALAAYFADPTIVKIGHAIGGLDVPSLHRDFGILVVNVFDTYEAAKQLHLSVQGLADLCHHYKLTQQHNAEYKYLKANYQNCDWTARPLSLEMIQYGRYDVNYLMALRQLMMRDLTRDAWATGDEDAYLVAAALSETLRQFQEEDEMGYTEHDEDKGGSNGSHHHHQEKHESQGNGAVHGKKESPDIPPTTDENTDVKNNGETKQVQRLDASDLRMQIDLARTLAISQERCKCLWKNRAESTRKVLDAMVQRLLLSGIKWTVQHNELYMRLVDWRERLASALETLPPFVAPLEFLVAVAYQRPDTEAGLRRISQRLPYAFAENEEIREELFEIVRRSLKRTPREVNVPPTCYYHPTNWLWHQIRSRGDSVVMNRWTYMASCVLTGAAVYGIVQMRKR